MSPAPGPVSRSHSYYALGVLFLVYAVNLLDRQLLAIMLEPIKLELELSDTALGFLTGFAFALFFSTAGIPIARWADRGSRVSVIAIGLAVWSFATATCGLARSFLHLAISRVGVSVGEAAGSPPAHSLISDYFPPEQRATAIAIFITGANFGIAAGLALGGYLSDTIGWRQTFLVVGLPGLAIALLVRFTLREPARGSSEGRADDGTNPPLREVLRYLSTLRSYRHVCIATALYNFASYGFLAWIPTFMIRVHEMSATEVGAWLGPIAGFVGAAGSFAGGWVGDWGARRDERWRVWLPAVGGICTAPFLFLFLLLDDPIAAVLSYIPVAFFGGLWAGPTYAVVQSLAPLRMRTMAAAVLIFVLNLFGMGLGPQMVGILSDAFHASLGVDSLRYALLAVGVGKVWGAVHSFLGARTLSEDLERART